MAPLSRDRIRPAEQAAIHHDAAADARAEDDAEHRAHPGAAPSVASDSAKQSASLARRTGRSRALDRSCPQGPANQPGRVGVLDEAGRGGLRARHPDADAAAARLLVLHRPDQSGDGRRPSRRSLPTGVGTRRRDSSLAARTQRDGLDLGASRSTPMRIGADVTADCRGPLTPVSSDPFSLSGEARIARSGSRVMAGGSVAAALAVVGAVVVTGAQTGPRTPPHGAGSVHPTANPGGTLRHQRRRPARVPDAVLRGVPQRPRKGRRHGFGAQAVDGRAGPLERRARRPRLGTGGPEAARGHDAAGRPQAPGSCGVRLR